MSPVLLKLLVLAIGLGSVASLICPPVEQCLSSFVSKARTSGHDRARFCELERTLVKCLRECTCSLESQSHKDSQIRAHTVDSQCNSSTAARPVLFFLLAGLITCFTTLRLAS